MKESVMLVNTVKVDDTYSVMVVPLADEYECYGKKHTETGSTPFMYMFGVDPLTTSLCEAVNLAIANVPFYDDMFEGE